MNLTKCFSENIIKTILIIGLAFILLYILMMGIKPWIDNPSWSYVHNVWLTWQTFNAGMIAFIASIIALYSINLSEKKKNERELGAAQVMLSIPLNDIMDELKEWAKILEANYNFTPSPTISLPPTRIKLKPIPSYILESFNKLALHCDGDHHPFISRYINDIQVIRARITSMNNTAPLMQRKMETRNVIIDIVRLCAKTNRLFIFSRGKSLFTDDLTKEELRTSIQNLDISKDPALNYLYDEIECMNLQESLPEKYSPHNLN